MTPAPRLARAPAQDDLFEKYRAWLTEAKLYDLNLLAHDWQALAAPRSAPSATCRASVTR
jgi:hypothetical protein